MLNYSQLSIVQGDTLHYDTGKNCVHGNGLVETGPIKDWYSYGPVMQVEVTHSSSIHDSHTYTDDAHISLTTQFIIFFPPSGIDFQSARAVNQRIKLVWPNGNIHIVNQQTQGHLNELCAFQF